MRPRALAAHHLRLFALLVDYLVVLVLGKLVALAWVGEGWDLRLVAEGGAALPWSGIWAALVLALLRDCVGGRSLGKRICGLQVVCQEALEQVPGFWRLVLRNAVLLALLPLEAVWVFMDCYYRRLGDRLSGALVVCHPAPLRAFGRLMGLCALFFALVLAAFLLTYYNLRRSAADALARELVRRHPQTLQLTGQPLRFAFQAGLQLQAQASPPQAQVILRAEGPQGQARVQVHLRYAGHTWQPERIQAAPAR